MSDIKYSNIECSEFIAVTAKKFLVLCGRFESVPITAVLVPITAGSSNYLLWQEKRKRKIINIPPFHHPTERYLVVYCGYFQEVL
jgi:hypothetical protein